MKRLSSLRLGVIADTHGLFDSAIVRHFQGVNHIIHAGDIGKRSVIEQLRMIAPVTAVSGNVDRYEESGFQTEALIKLNGFRIAIRHVVFEAGELTKEGRAFLDRPNRTSASSATPINRRMNGLVTPCCSIQDRRDRNGLNCRECSDSSRSAAK